MARARGRAGQRWACALLIVVALALAARCHAYPDRPIKLVVPFPPTGSPDIEGTLRVTKLDKMVQRLSTPSLTDSVTQELAYVMSEPLGQPVYTERRSGEQTVSGTRYVAQAAPDGYTLLFAGNPTVTAYPVLYASLDFDPRQALVPVAAVARMPMALIAVAGHPAKTVGDLLARARNAKLPVYYAALGESSTARVAGELLREMAGAHMVNVNFNGSQPALNALITKQVEFGWIPLPAVLPYLGGGKFRMLAIGTLMRHSVLPKVPTVAESGVPGYEASGWFGVFAPKRTAAAVLDQLNSAINQALTHEGFQNYLMGLGLAPMSGSARQFRTLIEQDGVRAERLLRKP